MDEIEERRDGGRVGEQRVKCVYFNDISGILSYSNNMLKNNI